MSRSPAEAPLSPPERLTGDHLLDEFDSGTPALDHWLKQRAIRNEAAGASRSFVLCSDRQVIGYYSLSASSVQASVATSRTRRNMPDPVPVLLLGRLAVDRRWQGRGLGADLLRDAVLRTEAASQIVGIRALLVHAMSDALKAFYERYGFRSSPIEPLTLMLVLDEVQRQ